MNDDSPDNTVRCCDCRHDSIFWGASPRSRIPPCAHPLFYKPRDKTEHHVCEGFEPRRSQSTTCPECQGDGVDREAGGEWLTDDPCPECLGHGEVEG